MKYAIIENHKVINTVVCDDPEFANERGWVQCPDHAGIDWDYVDGQFIDTREPEVISPDADAMRSYRNALLAQSDWTQLPDAPVDRAAWAAYRQALRDVPSQAGFPWDIQWPTQPE